ncbi:MAG: hypothetical protein AAFX06_20795 [Planctomycetota bacterium]
MSDEQKLSWSVPRWAYVPQVWRSLQKEVVNGSSLGRIVIVSVLVSVVLIGALKLAVPGFAIPNLGGLLAALPAILLLLTLQSGMLSVIPPRVTLRRDRLEKHHGQTALRVHSENILSAQVYVHREDRIRLKLRFKGRKREQTLVLGVSPDVDLDQLVGLLPVVPVIRDARSRRLRCLERGPAL